MVEAAVLADQARPDHRQLGSLVEQAAEQVERAGGDPRIGVEKQQLGTRVGSDGEVVCRTEADVGGIARQAHLRELTRDHLGRAVAGVVVDDVHRHRPSR